MTVRELNEKLIKIDTAINDVYRYFPDDKRGYYERPKPEAVALLEEYAELLMNAKVDI